jgi:3-methyladenine DNA glycosylase Tag
VFEIWSLTLIEEQRLKILNEVLRTIFELQEKKVTGKREKYRKEFLHFEIQYFLQLQKC